MTDLLKITNKREMVETLKVIAATEGIVGTVWNTELGVHADFALAMGNSNSLILFAKDNNGESLPPITLGINSIDSIKLDLSYGELTFNYTKDAFNDSYNSPKYKFKSLYVNSLNNSQEIHLFIRKSYRFENVPSVLQHAATAPEVVSDF
jgi:hypothetical protein